LSDILYQATAPVIVRALNKLSVLLDKAVEHGLSETELMDARLAPDMLPFPKQIQICSDTAKFAMARLTATEGPAMPDTENTIEELKARIARTVAYVQSVDKSLFAGAPDREIVLKFPSVEMSFTGAEYVTDFVLPNLFFHISIAYALLRQRGVKIGKGDFLPVDPVHVKFTG
jgi:hypothetical protein